MTTIQTAAAAARTLFEQIRAAIAETGEPGGRGPKSLALNALATDAAKLAFALDGIGAGVPGVPVGQ